MSIFDTPFDKLPKSIVVFPLSGVLLLPGGHLPLNIFEPRYLNMITDALATDRLVGMVQPKTPEEIPIEDDEVIKSLEGEHLPLYQTGCVGRIVQFEEGDDNRFLVTLRGICRFHLGEEMETGRGYRRFAVDWRGFGADPDGERDAAIDRERLLPALREYFRRRGISADWEAIEKTKDEKLVTTLSMLCPFGPAEKQALLDAPNLLERSRVLAAIAEIAAYDEQPNEEPREQ